MADDGDSFWFNSRTGEVEQGRVSPGADRYGPFATRAEAERAPERLQARSEAWAAEEAAEDDA